MNASVLVVPPKNVSATSLSSSTSASSSRQVQVRKLSYGQLALNSTTLVVNANNAALRNFSTGASSTTTISSSTIMASTSLLDNNNVAFVGGGGAVGSNNGSAGFAIFSSTTATKNVSNHTNKCSSNSGNSQQNRQSRSMGPKKSHSTTDLSQLKSKSSSSSNRSTTGGGGNGTSFQNGSAAVVQQSPVQSRKQQRQSLAVDNNIVATAPTFSVAGGVSPMSAFNLPNELHSKQEQPFLKKSHQERRFRRLFRSVPTDEILLSRFSCAFVSDLGLLLQGHLYVSYGWICFHSNIFGIEKIIEISVESIANVNKTRTAKIIPNAPIESGDRNVSGSTPGSPNDDNLSVSSCSSGGGDSSDDTSSIVEGLVVANKEKNNSNNVNNKNGISSKAANNNGRNSRNFLTSKSTNLSSKFSLQGFVAWFLSLPKIMMALIVCVALLSFLFMCATCLTIRLMYLHNPQSTLADLVSSTMQDSRKPVWTLDSFTRMNNVIDATLKLIDEVKHQLEILKNEVFIETSGQNVPVDESSNFVHTPAPVDA